MYVVLRVPRCSTSGCLGAVVWPLLLDPQTLESSVYFFSASVFLYLDLSLLESYKIVTVSGFFFLLFMAGYFILSVLKCLIKDLGNIHGSFYKEGSILLRYGERALWGT